MRIKLLEDYVCDVEWYYAYPADPRWIYYKAGETIWCSDEEAHDLIVDGIGIMVQSSDG